MVDHHIWRALWRWARRRHPNKLPEWVRQKCFRTLGHRHWVFATQTRGYNGKPSMAALISASDTRIVRHVRVKSDAKHGRTDVGAAKGTWLPKTTLAAAARQMSGMRSAHQRRRSMVFSTRCPIQGSWHSLSHQLEIAALYLPTSLPHRHWNTPVSDHRVPAP